MSDTLTRLNAALSGRYLIERELGQGGMATVYLAHDLKHDRDVAIKVLHPDLGAALGSERFLGEIRTTARLQHPHILALLDSGEADGLLYYVMPLVTGESLRARLDREHQLPVADAVRIAEEVADALQYAHGNGVVHRDIKPDNILMQGNHALVADFGIALALQQAAGPRLTQSGLSLGTPQYMAPEQAMAEKAIDGRADLYALGCVLYEMLVGEPPFTGPTAQVIVARAMSETPRAPSAVRPSIPAAVSDATLTALERFPADRQADAAQFARELRQADTPTRARQLPVQPAAIRRVILVGVLAAMVVTGVVLDRMVGGGAHNRPVTFDPQTFVPQRVFNARFAPDGRTMLFSAAAGSTTPQLFIIRPDYRRPESLNAPATHLLAVSSAGELAVLVRAQVLYHRTCIGTLATMQMGGTAPREIRDSVNEADWSPDGQQMAVASFRGGNNVLEYPVGTVRYQTTGWLSDIRISRDGRRLAFLEHAIQVDDRGRLVILDLRSGDTVRTEEVLSIQGTVWSPDGSEVFSAVGKDLRRSIVAYSLKGAMRPVLSSPGGLVMLDLAHDGRALAASDQQSLRVMVHRPGVPAVADESWRDFSSAPIFSTDGSMLVTEDQSAESGPTYATMLRRADGRMVRLGPGEPMGVSPDGKFVLAVVPGSPDTPVLYPVGPGTERKLGYGKLSAPLTFGWYPDGAALLVCGRETATEARCFRQSLADGSQRPATPPFAPDRLFGRPALAPDGQRVVIRDRLYATATDTGHVIPGLGGGFVLRWTPDGRQLYVRDPGMVINRMDPATGHREPFLRLGPLPFGDGMIDVAIGDDPDLYAYTVWHFTSQLYLVDGIH